MACLFALHVGLDDYASLRAARVPGGFRNLLGSVADARAWAALARDSLGVPPDRQQVLVNPEQVTREGARAALRAMLRSLEPGDRALFTWSGHGTQIPTLDPGTLEPDGLDEALVTSDFTWEGALRDGEIQADLAETPPGAGCTVIFDVCFSGSLAGEEGEDSLRAVVPPASLLPALRAGAAARRVEKRSFRPGHPALAVFAACQGDAVAKEVYRDRQVHGAFSLGMLRSLGALGTGATRRSLLERVLTELSALGAEGQIPVLYAAPDAWEAPFWTPTP